MNEVQISGINYRIEKLSAKEQFHLTRKLLPTLMAYGSVDRTEISNSVFALKPIASAIAEMSESDSNYVIDTCLSACRRQDGSGYQKVMTNGNLIYQDIDLIVMMRLCFEVIEDNLGNFFHALPSQ